MVIITSFIYVHCPQIPQAKQSSHITVKFCRAITTSWVLSIASYHLSAQPKITARLHAELAAVKQRYDWRQAERFPIVQ